MDADLKLLAEASLDVAAAEEALDEEAFTSARERLDAVDVALEELRRRWPQLGPGERAVVGPSAKAIRARLDAAARRVPRRTALTEVPPEHDPEEDAEPEAA